MQYKKLLALPINDIKNQMPTINNFDKRYNNIIYYASVDRSTGEPVLIIDFYTTNPKSKFLKRLFVNCKKWFSVNYKGTVSEASIRSYGWYYNYFFQDCGLSGYNFSFYPFSGDIEGCITDFLVMECHYNLNISESAYVNLAGFQDSKRKENLAKKHEKIRLSTYEKMLEINPLPKKVKEWVTTGLMRDCRYLFYEYKRAKNTTAVCSHCKSEVVIKRPHKDDTCICPHCHSKCICKPIKQYNNTSGFSIDRVFALLQKGKSGYWFRIFEVNFYFNGITLFPSKGITECLRENYPDTNFNHLKRDRYYCVDGYEWKRGEKLHYNAAYIYPGNLNSILKEVDGFNSWHLDFNKIARCCGRIHYNNIYSTVTSCCFFQNLINNGLTNLARDIINNDIPSNNEFDFSKGSLRKGAKISKDDLIFLKSINPNFKEIKRYYKYKAYTNMYNKRFNIDTFIEMSKILNRTYDRLEEVAFMMLKYSTWEQFLKFINKQEEIFKPTAYWYYNPIRSFFEDYKDYIEYAKLLEYNLRDLNILFPKNFKDAHDAAYKIINDIKFKDAQLPQIAKQHDKYEKLYYFEDEDFLIRPPVDHNEVKREGEKLNHCVATYAERIALGETIILFIREKANPDKPYFTLNLDPVTLNIIQNRGKNNCAYPDEVRKFTDKWQKVVLEKIKLKENIPCQKTA